MTPYYIYEQANTAATNKSRLHKNAVLRDYLFIRYLSIALAATLPAPIAEITVAAPVTASPPA